MLPQRADSILPVTIRHILITGRRAAAGFGPAAALLSEPCVPPPTFFGTWRHTQPIRTRAAAASAYRWSLAHHRPPAKVTACA